MITSGKVSYILLVIIVLLLFIGFIFSYLVIMRIIQTRREAKIAHYINQYSDAWYNYLVNGVVGEYLLPSHRAEKHIHIAVDRIFSNYVSYINNEDVLQRIQHYIHLNFQSYYRNMLASRDWGIRMNALYRIVDFRLEFLVDDVKQIARKKQYESTEEYLLILRIFATHNRNLFLKHFYYPSLNFKEFEYKAILSHLDSSYITQFIEEFEKIPKNSQIALLDYLSYRTDMDTQYLQFFEQLLQHYEGEVRIRSLRAISRFGSISDIKVYESFLHSEQWEERMMLAKLLVYAKEQDARPLLYCLVRDSSWWVRRQAAITLSKVRYGIEMLEETILIGDDPYAVEMAKEVLRMG